MANERIAFPPGSTSMYARFSGGTTYSGEFGAGYSWALSAGLKGGVRFEDIIIPKNASISHASLHMYCQDRRGAADIKIRIQGIDEDDTNPGEPFGRSHTTAQNTHTGNPSLGGYLTIGCANVIEEIVARSGWQSGNAIYLIVNDDGTTTDSPGNFTYDYFGGFETYLSYRVNAEPNFTPTAKSVAAPTFPTAKNFGWKQAYPGKNVFTATEDQLYLTTRKRGHKLSSEGVINTTANTVYNIAHGLGYAPYCLVYVKSNTTSQRFKLPRWFPVSVQGGPGSDGINGTIEINTTQLRILTTENAEVYYRIFVDELT